MSNNPPKRKILLIYPPSAAINREDTCQQPFNNLFNTPLLPPTDLMYLAAVAEKIGYEAKIADYSIGGDYKKDLETYQPDYLLVNVTTPTFKTDMEAITLAKEICPNITTIAKGATFLNHALDVMYFSRDLDFILYGEPEDTLRELLLGIAPYRILGLYYREDIRVKFTGVRPFIKDLDDLPFPARHLIDNNLYKRTDTDKAQAVIKVSRGCPFHCFFCLASPVSGTEVRMRTPQNIIDEIKECIEKYHIHNFMFLSDIFNADKKWVTDLCNLIMGNNIDIIWSANLRPDITDENIAKIMYQAGCRFVNLGVESGSQEILNNIDKKIALDDIRLTVKILKKYHISICTDFIIGLPWDTEETVEDTVDFALELNCDYAKFNTAVPLPGTKFYIYARENNLINSDTSFKEAYAVPTIAAHSLTKERILELHKQAIKKFYLRPAYIIKNLFKVKSKTKFKNYFKTLYKIIKL